jgi:uncharacterized damage-inducible protein DinB
MATSIKTILLEQFSRCYDQNGWFVSINNAVEDLSPEHAVRATDLAGNSIQQTLSHLTYYNRAYMLRFRGVEYEYDVDNNDETFREDEPWDVTLAQFRNVMDEFRLLIEAADESKLEEAVPHRTDRRWWELIADINAHNAYHAGQILLLRKLQGSWNPEKGVS